MKWSLLSVILEQPEYAELSSNLQQEFTDEVKKVFSVDCGPENKQWCSLLENLDTTVNRRYLLFTKLIILSNTMKHFLQLLHSEAKCSCVSFTLCKCTLYSQTYIYLKQLLLKLLRWPGKGHGPGSCSAPMWETVPLSPRIHSAMPSLH